MGYIVIVADNARYQDADAHRDGGTFATRALAIAACQQLVDDYLASAHRPGMSAQALFSSYTQFGEDPYIVGADGDGVGFSAWDYARGRCALLCGA